MKTLQELLQNKATLVTKQRALLDKARGENRDLTDVEAKEFDGHDTEIGQLETQIQAAEAQAARESRVSAREQGLDQSVQTWRPNNFVPGAPSQNNKKLDDGGFESLGEFVDAVRFGDPKGRLNSAAKNPTGNPGLQVPAAFRSLLLPRFRNEWSMGTGAEGGFAVPEQRSDQVLMIKPESDIVRSRATVIPAGDPPDAKITIPAFHQGANGVFGGVEVHWTEEGAQKSETDGELKEVSLEPHEVSATTVVSDKLLRNWHAFGAFATFLLRGAMSATEDIVSLRGDGVGKPIGILNGKGALNVNRTTANKVVYPDTINMLAKLLPESKSNALWIASQELLPEVATMVDGNGRYIFIQGDATRGIPDTLAGIPIRWTGKTAAKGARGDLMLVDLQYYLIKDGSGPFVAASEHVLFRQNKTVIKCFWNVDGKGWVDEPLTLQNGVTKVSPYVILDVPAA